MAAGSGVLSQIIRGGLKQKREVLASLLSFYSLFSLLFESPDLFLPLLLLSSFFSDLLSREELPEGDRLSVA